MRRSIVPDPPRRQPREPKPEQHPMQRENPAKMPAPEPNDAMAEKQALAMFNKKNPMHREDSHLLREITCSDQRPRVIPAARKIDS